MKAAKEKDSLFQKEAYKKMIYTAGGWRAMKAEIKARKVKKQKSLQLL